MDSITQQFSSFSDIGVAVTTAQMLICLLLSAALSALIAKVYQYTYRDASFSPAFMQTLVICCMVISAIMLIIGSNIARAFSLVGALSIIRFRNAVKDPRDVAFIFLVMAVGMGCGTGFYGVSCALTVVSSIVITAMSYFSFGSSKLDEKVVKIQAPAVDNFENLFDPVLAKHAKSFSLLAAERTQMGTELELTFMLHVLKGFSIEKLMLDLSKLNKNLTVQVLGSNFTYDL
jgi:uncharacterized membrane protein YhiD involved in acid resistance